jgi:N-acetylglutamate synthase-like GNAT family acetyltransferase
MTDVRDSSHAADVTAPPPACGLNLMLAHMHPRLHDGIVAFVQLPAGTDVQHLPVLATVAEAEGLTVVLYEDDAMRAGFEIRFRASWITLEVHSALEGVGLTAAVARALADVDIACNVIAGVQHDHLFVPAADGVRALAALLDAQRQAAPLAHRDGYAIFGSQSAVDVDAVHAFLTRAYWSEGIPRETVARAVRHSLCFSLYHGVQQVGFARVVTDCTTFAYLCDVYVLDSYRGRGLARWLMECVMAHRDLQGLRRMSLVTRDAHALYEQFGFHVLAAPDLHMEIHRPGLYRPAATAHAH